MKYYGHLMASPYNYYFFDTNRNSIIKISKTLYMFLKGKGTENLIPEQRSALEHEIIKLQSQGFLLENPIEEICNQNIEGIEYALENKCTQLILQVTKACNFRCSYCEFAVSENSDIKSFPASKENSMSWEIAKKAIDFFYRHTRDKRKVFISFYGGEPLIEFELIKKCISYSKEVFLGKKVVFGMTTNGSLLTPEIGKYLAENECKVVLSLDGPREIHNKNRKFNADGTGTFDAVIENIKKFQKENLNVIDEVNCVVEPSNDLDKVTEFFNEKNIGDVVVRTSLVNPRSGSQLQLTKEYNEKKAYYDYIGLLSFLYSDIEITSVFSKDYKRNLERFKMYLTPTEKMSPKIGHGGPCTVGVNRFYVGVDGTFYPCEKVNTVPHMAIGNIENGFNVDRIIEQTNVTKLTEILCKDCWCIRHCNLCVAHADDGEKLSSGIIHSECLGVKKIVDSKLRDLIAIEEAKQILYEEMDNEL